MRATADSVRKLISVLALLSLLALAGPGATPMLAVAAGNPIVIENQQPGSSAWQLTTTADDVSKQIKGYASSASVLQGGSLTLYVTVNPAQTYTIDFYRIGWYGGLGGRLELHVGPLTGVPQSACLPNATTGLIACNWTPSYANTIPTSWTSGVYMAVLTNAAGYQNYVNFVVRDGRPAPFLVQRSMNTAQAYNDYPNDGVTGKSLYEYNSYGPNTVAGTTRAVKVSFDRPFNDDGSGDFLSWEIQFVRWVEQSGYDVTYTTDVDTHANGAELLRHQAFLSIGHDEYWSNEMYNAAQVARGAGVNLAFFGANPIYWQVRFEASAAGVANRVMECYKAANIDPVQGPTTTVNWRDAPVNRPEQTLVGVMFTNETQGLVNVPYVVTNSSSWVYANTGFKDGDSVSNLAGYELDRYVATYPAAATNQVLLSRSPYTSDGNGPDYGNSSIYQAPSGAWVFATGTMSWSWALDSFATSNQPDARIQQATTNVLNAFLMGTATVHDLKLVAPAGASAGQPFSVTVTAEDANGRPFPSYTGTVHFSSTDLQAVLPANYTFTSTDAGTHSFPVTLKTAGSSTVTATDTVTSAVSGSQTVTVSSSALDHLALTPGSASITAGGSRSYTATGFDQYNNSLGDVTAGTTFSIAPNGSCTGAICTATVAGPHTVSGSNGGKTSTASLTVTPGPASQLRLTAPTSPVTPGSSFSLIVTLTDQYGNVAAGYTGTVHFTGSDPAWMVGLLATAPADYTFTAADAGVHTFSVTLITPPSQTITVTDTANGALTATSTISVT
jgi:N,N-dimethylformamidase beta subunit-like protein